ncbi:glycosyltransferase family 4 protein [Acidobacteriota bacterium]
MKRLNLLVSAYACNPLATEESYPGEAILGWNLIIQLNRFHNVSVLTRTYNKKGIEESAERENIEDVQFHFLNLPRFLSVIKRNFLGFSFYYLLWQIKAFFIARKIHKKNGYEVFHHITFNNDWMPSFIGAFLPLPFIWGPMGGGQKVPRSFKKTIHWKNRINQNLRLSGQWFWRNTWFRRRCVKKASAILVCNTDTVAKIKTDAKKIFFYPVNGISSLELNPPVNRNGEKSSPFRIIFAGRLDAIKGINLGIEAFHIFSREHPDSHFKIIGIGPEQERLENQADDLNIRDKVQFIPWLEREKLFEQLQLSDVLLFPSFRDGGGQVIIEAMACGKPVIGINVGGPGFHIQDEWGIKIDPKNPEYTIQHMAEALKTLYLNRDLREKMGEAGFRRTEEFYLWDRLGDQLKSIYQEVLPDELIKN